MRISASSLRSQVVLTTIAIVASVILFISVFFLSRHASDLHSQMDAQASTMREELRTRGTALVSTLALVSERALAAMDYSFLAEAVNATASQDRGIVYAMAMDTEGRVLVASDPNIVSTQLADPAAKFAVAQEKVTSQEVGANAQAVTEIVAPLRLANKHWGALRVGFSQQKLRQSLANLEASGAQQDRDNILLVALMASGLLLIASLLASLVARQVTQPLNSLTHGAEKLGQGDMNVLVQVAGSSEIRKLATSFNSMTRALSERDTALRENMRELATARDKAEESARLKGEFLANMSHELRTPLNAIVNVPRLVAKDFESFPVYHCAQCKEDYQRDSDSAEEMDACPTCGSELTLSNQLFYMGAPAETTRLLQRMMQSATRMLSLVNDLLDFSKLEAGKVQLYLGPVDVSQLLNEVRDTMVPLAEDKRIKLVLQPPAGSCVVKADPVKLNQVLVNLISNAIKFTPQDGSITIAAAPEGGLIHFSVRDTGIGIPKEKFDLLFQSFRQVDGSHTRLHQGTGLGLAISKRLLDLHQGKIWLESVPGEGSTFHFTVPVDTEIAKSMELAKNRRSLQVMIIDDSTEHLELGRLILERDTSIHVVTVQDSTQAVGQVQTLMPDCVILDVMMPQQSGLTILRQLKEDRGTSSIPVMVSTAYYSNKEIVERLGGMWLPKPWNEQTMAERIRAQLEGNPEVAAKSESSS